MCVCAYGHLCGVRDGQTVEGLTALDAQEMTAFCLNVYNALVCSLPRLCVVTCLC